MPAFRFPVVDLTHWLTWASLATGLAVCVLVFMASSYVLRRRAARALLSSEDEIPWESLLEMLKERYQSEKGTAYVESLSPEELLQALLTEMPRLKRECPPAHGPEDAAYTAAGSERRSSRRRWLNPTTVSFYTALDGKHHHGIVVNRSSGGVALLVDHDFPPEETLFVRVMEAPTNVPVIQVKVRHSRRAGRMHVLGCQYCHELPWNVKVWFG